MSEDEYGDESVTPEEFVEIKTSYDAVIKSVDVAKGHIEQNEIEDAIHTLSEIDTDCSICQGELEDAKQKLEVVHELCNIEKTASDQKCQKMSSFILNNLTEFVSNINTAMEELREEAYGEEEDS
ncbi:MAG: hypothetical protein KKD44_27115 [Proteobacteria bacterium]|nr:hypothetical protein [Pseudomonadota bacterium]